MTTPHPQTLNLTSLPPAKEIGKVQIQSVDFGGKRATQVTVHLGGGWSTDLKALHGTESCQKSHFGIMLSGKLAVRMDDGHEIVMGPNDLYAVPGGHDAWCVGDEPAVFLEFSVDGDGH